MRSFPAMLAVCCAVFSSSRTARAGQPAPGSAPFRTAGGRPPAGSLAEEIMGAAGVEAGLCVHAGCEDAGLIADMARDRNVLAHGIALDRESVPGMLAELHEDRRVAGRASAAYARAAELPYADDLVNLVVVDNWPKARAAGLSLKEVLRVACPGGVVFVGQRSGAGGARLPQARLKAELDRAGVKDFKIVSRSGTWALVRKPRPRGMDDWSHIRHGPAGTMTSADTLVRAPAGLRWLAGPSYSVVNRRVSEAGMVVGDGRIYNTTVYKEGGLDAPDRHFLIARDAYNGLMLWKLAVPGEYTKAFRAYRALAATLVAAEGRLFAVIKPGAPLQSFDADTGEVLRTYDKGGRPGHVILAGGLLLLKEGGTLRALDPDSGAVKWQFQTGGGGRPAVVDGKVYFAGAAQGKASVVGCLDLQTGRGRWMADAAGWASGREFGRRLKLHGCGNGVLAFGGAGGVHVVSAKDGRHLWNYRYNLIGHGGGYHNILFAKGLVWIHAARDAGRMNVSKGEWIGFDPATGRVRHRFDGDCTVKHRCHPDRATPGLILYGSMDVLDLAAGTRQHAPITRQPCGVGAIPANGLVYALQHNCQCLGPTVRGFAALCADAPPARPEEAARDRLEEGPASAAAGSPRDDDWPTYRRDGLRSGAAGTSLPGELGLLWSAEVFPPVQGPALADWARKLGRWVSAPVVAGDLAVVACPFAQEVVALDAESGEQQWRFPAGGRVDSPPTLSGGLCIFGCRDGYVYALRARDGALVWRFRAAPEDRRIVAFGQIESVWPVFGSVAVRDGKAYYAAGRSTASDGGVFAGALDARTGRPAWETAVTHGEGRPAINNVVCISGESLLAAGARLDARTGLPLRRGSVLVRNGLFDMLDNTWVSLRTAFKGNQNWRDDRVLYAQVLVRGPRRSYGARSRRFRRRTEIYRPGVLFAKSSSRSTDWEVKMPDPFQAEAMLLAGDRLFVAGPADWEDRQGSGALLLTVSADDGRELKRQKLPGLPVVDGMAAARNRLYLSTRDGLLLCFGKGGRM